MTGSFRRNLGGLYDFTTIQLDGSFKVGSGLRWTELQKMFDDTAMAYAAGQRKLQLAVRKRPKT